MHPRNKSGRAQRRRDSRADDPNLTTVVVVVYHGNSDTDSCARIRRTKKSGTSSFNSVPRGRSPTTLLPSGKICFFFLQSGTTARLRDRTSLCRRRSPSESPSRPASTLSQSMIRVEYTHNSFFTKYKGKTEYTGLYRGRLPSLVLSNKKTPSLQLYSAYYSRWK